MFTWHSWQTTNVLRRRAAMIFFHTGTSRPPLSFKSASLRMWWTSTFSVELHSSHLSARSRLSSSVRPTLWTYGLSLRTACGCRVREIPPNRAMRGGLFSRSRLTSKQVRVFPSGVCVLALYLAYMAATDVWCLQASVFMSDCSAIQRSLLSLPTL